MPVQTEHDPRLQKTLTTRHLRMLALGGVIGAGLFVGSSAIIVEAGPGAFLTYAITGVLVFLVMRMLGEMASAKPTTGSFTDYAGMALGRWAGFTTGWLYWYFWVIVVGFEAVVGGQIIHGWAPALPVWAAAFGLLVVMTGVNLLSVKTFGEAEYWFAGIKVAAILVFLLVTGLYVLHLWPGSTASLTNLTAHGGFLPHGVGTLFSGVVVVIFAMTGVEVVTIAAAESEEPGRNIRRAVNSVVFRILFFFVSSTLLIVIARPWNTFTVGESPFVAVFDTIGIPGAGVALRAVILVAVLSVLNSGLRTSSRARRARGRPGVDAPGRLARGARGGSAVRCCGGAGSARSRRSCGSGWAYPVLPLLVAAAIVAVLVSMAFSAAAGTRASLLARGVILAIAPGSGGAAPTRRRRSGELRIDFGERRNCPVGTLNGGPGILARRIEHSAGGPPSGGRKWNSGCRETPHQSLGKPLACEFLRWALT
ncbi:amino acid permease [Saccharopolyspora sp. 6T]|uniref:amino acid permease n=1 Tax=Saccharopolyspora sp. 6T TaxID=2877238 RepID=UPI001CD4697E|nr:amino acid permease [Saccharopolyspora sp. 6T]MCA1188073.1 amino acid permease [Saccharopolyspora sp. 6T]